MCYQCPRTRQLATDNRSTDISRDDAMRCSSKLSVIHKYFISAYRDKNINRKVSMSRPSAPGQFKAKNKLG